MANEKVSQMVSLTAGEVAGNDLFMIVDSSARESKKISITDVITYFEATGSFSAHAILADTASYIHGVDVAGSVTSASYSQTSTSASHANNSNNADNAITASFALNGGTAGSGTTLFTGSTYQITASAARSASYAVLSTFASSSNVTQFLQYTGVNNGTSSFALSSINTITASYARHADTASLSTSSSFASTATSASSVIGGPNLLRAYCWVTWSGITGKFNSSDNTVYQSYNISSFTYDSSLTTGSQTIDFFIVQFTNPLSSIDYMFLGNTTGFIYNAFQANALVFPYQDRDINGFTCSISMPTSQEAVFYASASLTFQVIGLP